jgi:hypothetical protein
MTVPEILKELEPYTGRFPMKAMRAAVEQREAITPELLKVLEACAEDPVAFARREDHMLHLFGLFLLAEFREKRACPLAVKIFSAPGEVPFDLYGDTVTEGIERDLRSRPEGCRERHYVITDAINEMEWWAAFHMEKSRPRQVPNLKVPVERPEPARYAAPQPVFRNPKIGRNDPCPCRNGKKHKKCCGKN